MNHVVRLVGRKSNWPNVLLTIAVIALVIWLLAWAVENGYLNFLTTGV
jgi:hypothetical protein